MKKEEDNDQWLKDLFTQETETGLPMRFEANLMRQIGILEEQKQVRKHRLNVFWIFVCSLVSGIGVVATFAFYGLYKPIFSSMDELFHHFTSMKLNSLMFIPIVVTCLLLIVDLFARKLLAKD